MNHGHKSPRVGRFIEEASKPNCKNGVEAALNAGYSHNCASETAARLLADQTIVAAIHRRIQQRSEKLDITPELVLRHWFAVATADPSSLIRTRRLNCRYCHGRDHGYQWADWEFAEEAAKAMDQGEAMPDQGGGVGWVFNADPNPDCPRCRGEGVPNVYVADISTVPEKDRVLFAGIKQTKDGIEMKTHDQQWAWDRIAGYMGMIVNKCELTGKDGKPLMPGAGKPLPMIEDVLPSDPKALEQMYLQYTKGV